MSGITETQGAAVVAGAYGLLGTITGNPYFLILAPTIVGAAVHVIDKNKAQKLTRSDLIVAGVVAVAVGGWGGPWVADMAPSSEKALPFMCFFCALFATPLLKGLYDFAMKKLGNNEGAN